MAEIQEINLERIYNTPEYFEEWTGKECKVFQNLKYGSETGNEYDLYIPAKICNDFAQGLILFVHGGSWAFGAKEDFSYACRRYVKAGYITATMNYSMGSLKEIIERINAGEENVTFDPSNTKYNLNTQMDNIEQCIRSIKSQTEKMGIQIKGMAISGGSAGGHLSMMYTYLRGLKSPIPIRFIFQQVGPVDFHLESWGSAVPEDCIVCLIDYLSGKYVTKEMIRDGKAEDIICSLSPINYIKRNPVPMVYAYGGKDVTVASCQKEKLEQALYGTIGPYTYVGYPNSDHPMHEDPDSTKAYIGAVLAYCKMYFGY